MVEKSPPRPGDVNPSHVGLWTTPETTMVVADGLQFSFTSNADDTLRIHRNGVPLGTVSPSSAPVVVDGAHGYGLLIRDGGAGPEVAVAYPEGCTELRHTPLGYWADCAEDPWLQQRASGLSADDPWMQAVVLGCSMRQQRPSTAVAAARTMALLAGKDPAGLGEPARWARRLSPNACTALLDLTHDRMRGLSEQLELIWETVDPHCSEWLTEASNTLRARDDLENATLVLSTAPQTKKPFPLPALSTLDTQGQRWVQAAPEFEPVGDLEGLLRTASDSPNLWWVQPVR